MFNLQKNIGRLIMLLSIIGLTACSSQAEATQQPSLEPNAIYTSAAETVQAQLTIASAMTQAVQPTEPQETPTPKETATLPPLPTIGGTPALPPGATPAVPLGTIAVTPLAPAGATPAVPSLATVTPLGGGATVAAAKTDKGELIGQIPNDGATFYTDDTDRDISWTLKNTGTTTWTTKYYLLYSGISTSDRIDGSHKLPKIYYLPNNVKPNETVTITVDVDTTDMKAGTYRTSWNLWNDQGQWFFWDLYCTIQVVK